MASTSERAGPHTPAPPDAPAAPSGLSPERNLMVNGTFVRVLIVAIAAIVIAMMALLFYRWRAVPEPSAVILVQGDESDDGAEIVVTSNENRSDRVTAALGHSTQVAFVTPIIRLPGSFHITITRGAETIVDQDLKLEDQRGYRVDVTTILLIGSEALEGTRVEITGEHNTWQGTLDHDHADRLRFPDDASPGASSATPLTVPRILAGKYHLVATRGGKTIRDEFITKLVGQECQVNLTKPPAHGSTRPVN